MDFSIIENNIRQYWKENDIQNQIRTNRKENNSPKWEFLDGPPFVNGKPHHGHLLVSTIKDTMARFMSQKGHEVSYQIGFDCHGLPLEQEAEKVVGKVSPTDSQEKIQKFNNTCRDIIKNCSETWYDVLGQLGRQFDIKETYYTSDFNYMKSLWTSFKTLWDKDLIYCSKKVMPYSPLCETPLSNFEANQNYKERTDISVFVRFKVTNSCFVDSNKNEYLLIWTTTPWSLFANQGICINPELTYSLVEFENNYYWITNNSIERVFEPNKIKIIHTSIGKELTNIKYETIYPLKEYINYRVYADSYVDDTTGTGLVHLAPLFGEDDMRVMKMNGYTMDMLPNIVDNQVRFNFDYFVNSNNICDKFVMDTSLDITIDLKSKGICLKSEKIKHNYPYCWRTDTPLVYLATDAWFLKVQTLIPDILENNKKIVWYPEYVGTERFANWIKNAPDWCLSRNRIWGTPIPIWESHSGKKICISDISELSHLCGREITDLHLDNIYNLTFELDGETYSRTFGVLDCWFESGMAPYARNNSTRDPVDFIAESLDQTRGWFYTLNVLSTALYNQPAFKKVIVSGLILAEDGKKMSKRLGNYTNPLELMNKYGSDVFRLYLLSSTASKAESFCFKDKDLIEISRKLIPYANSFIMFSESLKLFNEPIGDTFKSTNKLDIWLYNIFHSFKNSIYNHLENLELTHIPSLIYKFIDQLCNTYIKLSRDRLKSQCTHQDALESLTTLNYILDETNLLLVPFVPHLAEHFNKLLNKDSISIHMRTIDLINKQNPDNTIIQSIDSLNELFETVRTLRNKINIGNVYPLDSLEIYTGSTSIIEFTDVIKKELNIKSLIIKDYNELPFSYRANRSSIGKTFKSKASEIVKQIELGDISDLSNEYYTIEYNAKSKDGYIESKFEYYDSNSRKQEAVVYLTNKITEENKKEAHLNHIRRQINLLRKQWNYKMSDKINITMKYNEVFELFSEEMMKQLSNQLGSEIKITTSIGRAYDEITTLNDEYGIIRVFLEKV